MEGLSKWREVCQYYWTKKSRLLLFSTNVNNQRLFNTPLHMSHLATLRYTCYTLQHSVTHVTHCNIPLHMSHLATLCNTCYTLQHSVTHVTTCNTPLHMLLLATLRHTCFTAKLLVAWSYQMFQQDETYRPWKIFICENVWMKISVNSGILNIFRPLTLEILLYVYFFFLFQIYQNLCSCPSFWQRCFWSCMVWGPGNIFVPSLISLTVW